MSSIEHIRATALILRECISQLHSLTVPIWGVCSTWDLTHENDDLPPEGDVREQVEAYRMINVPPLSLSDALRDLLSSAEPGSPEGTYSLPETATPIIFSVQGGVPVGELANYAVGADVVIERITVYSGLTGTGSNFNLDILCNSVSLFLPGQYPSLPPSSTNTVEIIGTDRLQTTELVATDILTFECLQTPVPCENVGFTIWVKTA